MEYRMWNIVRSFQLFFIFLFAVYSALYILPSPAAVAAGSGYITASGGGTKTAGSNFTVTVYAGGATFDSVQGTISVSGPVTIVGFAGGSATWLPGKSPANNNQFVGITSARSYLTVATVTLRGTGSGSGSVKVSGVRLANNGAEVGTTGGSASFTIVPAPTPPGTISVSSSTHPDPKASYDNPDVKVSWKAPSNGASGYSYVFDSKAKTTPPTKIKTEKTSAEFTGNKVGTYYFHVRANNDDGWGPTTHFKINIVPKTDATLSIPTIEELRTTDNRSNDLDAGTVSGILLRGTGPAGFTLELTITPDWKLNTKKYPAPVISEDGSWQLTVSDPIKAGYYQLAARAKKDSQATASSPTIGFEISLANGGEIRLVDAEDETTAFNNAQAAEAELVAGQQRREKLYGLGGWLIILTVFGLLFFLKRELILKS